MREYFKVMSRRQIMDGLREIRCLLPLDTRISKTPFAYHEAFTDTEMATLWFQHFGEVVHVGNSRLHEVLVDAELIALVTTQIVIETLMRDSKSKAP